MRPEQFRHRRNTEGGCFVEKLYTYPDLGARKTRAAFLKEDRDLQTIVNDGGLEAGLCRNWGLNSDRRDNVVYSLNKLKRWTLPSLLQEAVAEKLADARFSVSCVVRALQPDIQYTQRGFTADAVSVALHRDHSHRTASMLEETGRQNRKRNVRTERCEERAAATPNPILSRCKRERRPCSLNDLVIRSQGFQEETKSISAGGFKSVDARRSALVADTDFGIMYNISSPDTSKTAKRQSEYRDWYNFPKNSKRKRRQWLEETYRSYVAGLEDEIGEPALHEIPVATEETGRPQQSSGCYDLAGLLIAQQTASSDRKIVRRRPTAGLISLPVVVSEDSAKVPSATSDSVVPSVVQPLEEAPSAEAEHNLSVRSRAADESQRTFLFPDSMDDLCQIFKTTDEKTTKVMFLDVSAACAVVLLAKSTLFGLEVTLKGPPAWLYSLPESTSLSSFLSFLRLRKPSPSIGQEGSQNCLEKYLAVNCTSTRTLVALQPIFSFPSPAAQLDKNTACLICGDDWDVLRNVCGHTACRSCWKLHVVAKVSEGLPRPQCFVVECADAVHASVIALAAPWHAIEAWQNRNLDLMVTSRQGMYCPTARCTGLVFPDLACLPAPVTDGAGHGNTLCRCQSCRKLFCSVCRESWHWPCPCAAAESYHDILELREHDPWLRNQKKPKYLAQTKKCPTCLLPMEKNLGCNHMSCICGAQFCWNCARLQSAHYKDGEYAGCFERALEVIDVEDGVTVSTREASYKVAVDIRARRYGLRHITHLDADMREILFYLYHVMEYVAAYESQQPTSQRAGFTAKRALLDLLFLCDRLLAHCNDEYRAVFVDLAKSSVLQLQAEFRDRLV